VKNYIKKNLKQNSKTIVFNLFKVKMQKGKGKWIQLASIMSDVRNWSFMYK